MLLSGEMLIGNDTVLGGKGTIRAVNPATGSEIEPAFGGGDAGDVARACALAAGAFPVYRNLPLEQRAGFLEAIAEQVLALGDGLIERAMLESGLPRPRLEGERGRTISQLKLFAAEVRDSGWIGARIDTALPERKPLPRSDIRLARIPLGPVAVFGASNFPLAFSVAGGDTASALAAGCPVIVKAHNAHPGTSALVAFAIRAAAKATGMPDGVFSLLFGADNALGTALVADPRVAAVGFTGSRRGGKALMAVAAARAVPIPVYAEMSSINPVILFPAALAARGPQIAKAFATSLTMGAGQFCTNPGLLLALDSPGIDRFIAAAGAGIASIPAATMLTPGIHAAYESGVSALAANRVVETLARGPQEDGPHQAQAGLFQTKAAHFTADHRLSEEVFGPASLLVRCANIAELRGVLEILEGQLTIALHMDADDQQAAAALMPVLETKAGRILVNGFGTGVEVSHAMVHGGPYPATSDGRSTSVGSLAIERFLRPVCYQDMPDHLLPEALKAANPLGIWRRTDGIMEMK
ncbi:MAG TPA: aldehyde dehydrogenase (NADP(+)) [Rhizomicrobium sp.]|nr:aldehyde dehydrogenase (NADP(+)) [Rhizomicrobium sp.]